MRRHALIFASTLLVIVTLATSAGATVTVSFDAQFRQHFGRGVGASSGPCDIAFCGSGQVMGYGDAELTIIVTSADPIALSGCDFALAVTGTATIQLTDGSRLVLDETGTYCLPGGSSSSPGNFFHSYGNPWEIDATYTITGGTGAFAGATGGGANAIREGGDAQVAVYAGTLLIP